MSARSMASSTIAFGLVTVPVRLYPAAESGAAISFNLLHAGCGARLRQQYVCTKDGEIVPRDQMVKGFEFEKDQYVTFTDEELKAMAEASSQTIDIHEFVPAAKVDPVYFENAYYLGPDKSGERGYHLLAAAMKETGRAALAKWSARGKQYLVLVRPIENGLAMQILHHAEEVRDFSEVPIGDVKVRDSELKLAVQLIDQITNEEFEPTKYEDDVRKRYREAIAQKVSGQEVRIAPAEKPRGQVIDLMEALKASLGNKAGRTSPRAAEPRKPAKRAGQAAAAGRETPRAASRGKR